MATLLGSTVTVTGTNTAADQLLELTVNYRAINDPV